METPVRGIYSIEKSDTSRHSTVSANKSDIYHLTSHKRKLTDINLHAGTARKCIPPHAGQAVNTAVPPADRTARPPLCGAPADRVRYSTRTDPTRQLSLSEKNVRKSKQISIPPHKIPEIDNHAMQSCKSRPSPPTGHKARPPLRDARTGGVRYDTCTDQTLAAQNKNTLTAPKVTGSQGKYLFTQSQTTSERNIFRISSPKPRPSSQTGHTVGLTNRASGPPLSSPQTDPTQPDTDSSQPTTGPPLTEKTVCKEKVRKDNVCPTHSYASLVKNSQNSTLSETGLTIKANIPEPRTVTHSVTASYICHNTSNDLPRDLLPTPLSDMGNPTTPNGQLFVSTPSSKVTLITPQSNEFTTPLAEPGDVTDHYKNTGHPGAQKVCTPRKTLKARIIGDAIPYGNAHLPQLEHLATPVARKLHKMGNNSLFNFGFKSTNLNKHVPIQNKGTSIQTTCNFLDVPKEPCSPETDRKVCNVHTAISDCDCMNPFLVKLPSELLHLTQTNDTVDTTDNNSQHVDIDVSANSRCIENLDTTLETLKQLDTELDSEISGNQAKRVRFEIDDHHDHHDPQHNNIHVRPTELRNKSLKRTRIPETEPLEYPKRFKGTDRTSTDQYDSHPKPPDTTDTTDKNRFRRFKYTPGTCPWHTESEPKPFSLGQVPVKKFRFIDSLTEDQRTRWYKARGMGTNSDRQAYHFSWVDQALSSFTNTHWAFGTTGLPPWAIGNAKMVSDIFQVRANASREVMEIVRENLRRESSLQQVESQQILDDLEAEFDAEQVSASRAAVELHSSRHLKQLSESLSKRREWLLENQPTEVEAITMRPERRSTKTNETPKELLSDEDDDDADVYADEYEQPAPKRRTRKHRRTNDEGHDTHENESTPTTSVSGRRRPRRRPSGQGHTRSTYNRPADRNNDETPDYQANRPDNTWETPNPRGHPGQRVRGRRPFRRGQRGTHSTLSRESNRGKSTYQSPSRVKTRPYTYRRQTHQD